uniref:Uncharacterized protein n=1 Tax=Arundo donax TaxID=35708 RepID=A0A0A8YMH3_ARUDO
MALEGWPVRWERRGRRRRRRRSGGRRQGRRGLRWWRTGRGGAAW